MSDIDGMDAFNAMMDRLIDAEVRAARSSTENSLADQERRRAETDARNLKERLAQVKSDNDKMTSAGIALLELVRKLKQRSPELEAAIEAASKAFDEIPF